MKAEEFYLDEYKGVFYSGDGEFEKAVFRFAEAYAEHENKELEHENKELRELLLEAKQHILDDRYLVNLIKQALKK